MNNPDRTSGSAAPDGIDRQIASNARVYDAMLGGKDNFAVDREVICQLREAAPELPQVARDNREWLTRVTRFLAGEVGIDQFLDLGSGLPCSENTHEAAQRVNPDAEVVYVDHDPVVLAHARALLEDNSATHILDADLTKAAELFDNEHLIRWLDLDRPVALFQVATLHHIPDADDPAGLMRAYIDALPAGSYVALTHFHNPGGRHAEVAEGLQQRFLDSGLHSGWFRTTEEIAGFLDGLELVDPGLSTLPDWWPDGPRVKPLLPVQHCMLGGVGRKP